VPDIAAFDVDRTLTVRDCVVPFMSTVAGRGGLASAVLSKPVSVGRWAVRGGRDDLKAHMVERIFAGKVVDEVVETGVRFAHRVVSGWMRADTMGRLRWHQERGDVVLLVSASLDAYLDPLGDLLEVDAVLCTRLGVRDGVHDGSLAGPNCRGPEKVARIRQWMNDAGLSEASLTWAYGDSSGDRQMLAMARHPLMVGRADVPREAGAA
jgi:phosphatidylglycerophosphatase C